MSASVWNERETPPASPAISVNIGSALDGNGVTVKIPMKQIKVYPILNAFDDRVIFISCRLSFFAASRTQGARVRDAGHGISRALIGLSSGAQSV
ncbi:MAG: hypothetical protein ABL901_05555 [Hyphomicrobiaceae bacterium]